MLKFTKLALITLLASTSAHAGIVSAVVNGAIVSDGLTDAARIQANAANRPDAVVTTGQSVECDDKPIANGCAVKYEFPNGFSHNYGSYKYVDMNYAEYVSYVQHIKLSEVVVTKVTRIYGENHTVTSLVIEYTVKE